MDSQIDNFVRQVIDYRHTQISPTDTQRLAQHCRTVILPQLEEREALLVENAALKKQLAQATAPPSFTQPDFVAPVGPDPNEPDASAPRRRKSKAK